MRAARKERQIYRETYRRGALKLNKASLPELRHVADGGTPFKAVECEILAAGKVERPDGTLLEYQDIRVYLETPQ